MDTQQNPDEPGKSSGQQGGQEQDRERERERERSVNVSGARVKNKVAVNRVANQAAVSKADDKIILLNQQAVGDNSRRFFCF